MVLTSPFLGHLVHQSMQASHAAPLPRTRPPRGDHAASASGARPAPTPWAASVAGLGRQTVAQLVGRPAVHGGMPHLTL
jgi:hypothetical protein